MKPLPLVRLAGVSKVYASGERTIIEETAVEADRLPAHIVHQSNEQAANVPTVSGDENFHVFTAIVSRVPILKPKGPQDAACISRCPCIAGRTHGDTP